MCALAPHDHCTQWIYYNFGAVCPAEGKDARLVAHYCESHAMQQHPEEIGPLLDSETDVFA